MNNLFGKTDMQINTDRKITPSPAVTYIHTTVNYLSPSNAHKSVAQDIKDYIKLEFQKFKHPLTEVKM